MFGTNQFLRQMVEKINCWWFSRKLMTLEGVGLCLSGGERVKVFDAARVIIAGTGSKQPADKIQCVSIENGFIFHTVRKSLLIIESWSEPYWLFIFFSMTIVHWSSLCSRMRIMCGCQTDLSKQHWASKRVV